jgi:hypothetical protein
MAGSFSTTSPTERWRDDVIAMTSWSSHGIASYNPDKTARIARSRGGESMAKGMGMRKEKKKPKKEKKK